VLGCGSGLGLAVGLGLAIGPGLAAALGLALGPGLADVVAVALGEVSTATGEVARWAPVGPQATAIRIRERMGVREKISRLMTL
jgi:hypothetical protein